VVTSSFEPGGGREVDETAEDVEVRLGVEGIEFSAPHGVYDEEAERGNRFRVDVHVKGPWSRAVRSDELRDTLDYDHIVQHIHRVSLRRRFHLIESFAGAIAHELLSEIPDLTEVRVSVRKLSLPVWGPEACATAEVTVRPR
jgi:dihydroneopterin aldolase